MSTLIIFLPSTAPGATASYDYAVTTDGTTLAGHASVALALLPAPVRGGEVVAVVPVAQLSWHTVALPHGVGPNSPRLRAVLDGLLEDRLLDDADQLHLALAPGAAAGAVWVAACDKAWLRGHLQALEAAQRPVARVVPEFAPEAGPLQFNAIGDSEQPQLVVTGQAVGGLMHMPLTATALALLPASDQAAGGDAGHMLAVLSEPGVVALAEQWLQRPVEVVTRPQRLLDAARSTWDLAQFDLASSGRARTLKRLSGLGHSLLQSPDWRPARWGAALLLLANLVGLNAWAWKEQSDLQARRVAVQALLTQTFPQVRVVVDAPVQMAREVAALRQATGAASAADLEAMLAALGAVLPAGRSASAIEFSAGQARLQGLPLSAQEAGSLSAQLQGQGYRLRQEGDILAVQPVSAREATP